jgi:dihydrofolate reductase
MAKLIYELNQSLDGYVDHAKMGPPHPELFHHFIERVRSLTGMLYGRRMYEIMSYWDDDLPDWGAEERDYAAAWRSRPKWVVSRGSKPVGANASLLQGDLEAAVRELKSRQGGEIEVAGPELAGSLTQLGLIDEYRIYLHPVVLGGGKPFFVGSRPPLRLVANEPITGDVIRLSYVPS